MKMWDRRNLDTCVSTEVNCLYNKVSLPKILNLRKFCRRAPAIDGLFDQREQSTHFKMLNEEGENVDLYIPRKCSWTNRLIEAKDHASVQINVGHLDQSGVFNGKSTVIALSGYVRNMVSNLDATYAQMTMRSLNRPPADAGGRGHARAPKGERE